MEPNIAYVGLGFASVLLGLEAAWHFTVCKIKDKSIKPCLYKQIGILKQKGKGMDLVHEQTGYFSNAPQAYNDKIS